jgi:sugar phosphate isomerase/epimerase
VILHVGSIEMKNYTDKLLELVERGEKQTPRYEKLCADLAKKRESKKAPFFERTKASLKRILPAAEKSGIKLGIENRQGLEELPVESDFPFLFHEVASSSLVYWHDTGHAQIKENLGFIRHSLHLESLGERLAGFHIHDVRGAGQDHAAPGTGNIDFASLTVLVKADHIKVFEFSPSLTLDEVKTGVAHVKGLWGET